MACGGLWGGLTESVRVKDRDLRLARVRSLAADLHSCAAFTVLTVNGSQSSMCTTSGAGGEDQRPLTLDRWPDFHQTSHPNPLSSQTWNRSAPSFRSHCELDAIPSGRWVPNAVWGPHSDTAVPTPPQRPLRGNNPTVYTDRFWKVLQGRLPPKIPALLGHPGGSVG